LRRKYHRGSLAGGLKNHYQINIQSGKCQKINYQRDNDWSKVKEIPTLNCFQCGECIKENNGCCSNCNVNLSVSEETHCKEHNHKYSHYHSPEIPQKLIILPIFLAAIIIWLVQKITKFL